MAGRHYNEKEIGALIQRATELHEASLDAQGPSQRLSLEEIEHIAAEMGVPPEHVRKAALEFEQRPPSKRPFSLFGSPFFEEHDEVLPGELTDAQWETIVLAIRDYTGSSGKTTELGTVKEWARVISDGSMTLSKIQVSLRPGKDHTSMKIRRHFGGGAVVSYMLVPLMLSAMAGVAIDGAGFSDALAFLTVGGTFTGSLGLVRTGIALWSRRLRKKARRLADMIRDTWAVTQEIEKPALTRDVEPAINLNDAVEEKPEHAAQKEGRIRMNS